MVIWRWELVCSSSAAQKWCRRNELNLMIIIMDDSSFVDFQLTSWKLLIESVELSCSVKTSMLLDRLKLASKVRSNSNECWHCSDLGNSVHRTWAQRWSSADRGLLRCRSTSTRSGSLRHFQTSHDHNWWRHLETMMVTKMSAVATRRVIQLASRWDTASRERQPVGQRHRGWDMSEIEKSMW